MRLKAVDALRALLFASALGASTSVAAGPVVVELFTSQGCSSCPPADELLGELADEPSVVALSLHVPYWDYIGWKDQFATPAFEQRQRKYNAVFGRPNVYTPQLVVQGREHMPGNRAAGVMMTVTDYARKQNPADVRLRREGDELVVDVAPAGAADQDAMNRAATIWVFGYTGPHEVTPDRGENRNDTITYHNVVREYRRARDWDAATPIQFRVEIDDQMGGYAVVVQEDQFGGVYGAGKIDF